MSEIKGTLLSIVLALAMFGVVLGIMTTTFKDVGDKIGENAVSLVENTDSSGA